jgi:ribosome-associated toxin RatA of RatAB toxin-antitoxin module
VVAGSGQIAWTAAEEERVERTAERMVVQATPERCIGVVCDVEAYPQWVADMKDVRVLERDGEGKALVVAFRAGAFGRSTSYVLAYDYSELPAKVSWSQRDGDITRSLDGSYEFVPTPEGGTEVVYQLAIDLRVPVPGFVRRRAEAQILHAALRDLKSRVESTS